MATTQDDMIAELQRTIVELRRERDAALAQRSSEYGERIAHQAATIDVLKVMSASPGDPRPVFDLIANRARDLCDGYGVGVFEFDGSLIHLRAYTGVSDDPEAREAYEARYPMPLTREVSVGRAIMDSRVIRIDDLDSEPGIKLPHDGKVRSVVAVPMMRGCVPIGGLALGSGELGGFTDSQIELLKTFAEQAVIAIGSAETYRALQARTNDLQESLEYQTATSDVLKVISRSTFDLQPVLDTVAETAARLCDADQAAIYRREGDSARLVANIGFPPEYETYTRALGAFPIDPNSAAVGQRTLVEGRPVHVHDVAAVPGYWEIAITLGRQRTSLGVPLLREGETIGNIMLARQRVEPFTDRQIELVSTFADQAVIAIENTRLLTEQREALEQQTATAEVLQVINALPGDLAPVFETMLDRAMRLCGAAFGELYTFDGENFRTAAHQGIPTAFAEFRRRTPPANAPGSMIRRVLEGASVMHIADAKDDDLYRIGEPTRVSLVDLGGARTVLTVVLRKDESLLGFIVIYRQEVRPFSDRQVALLQNFAAQAVIAMENARLITEQREALERQTATADVLQVINASPGDLGPVFDTMLEKAMRLCGAAFGSFYTYDGEQFLFAAQRGLPEAFAEFRTQTPLKLVPGSQLARAIENKRTLQVIDLKAEELYLGGNPFVRAMVELGGVRTILTVPLCKDEGVLGFLSVYRQEVRAFSDKQIALLENFAAQAVIAMENARLITEQREALEQQTATAEVLQVINSSPGDLGPVFDAMLERAITLCHASFGILWEFDSGLARAGALHRVPVAYAELCQVPFRPSFASGPARIMRGEGTFAIADLAEYAPYQAGDALTRAIVDLAGARSVVITPLRKDAAVLGAITLYRQEVLPFTDKQIALLENFAAQAVIAMENARLLDEIRQRQEELRITFENMGDGVAMFDEAPRLVAWNRKFQHILDVPDEVMEQRRTFDEYIRYLTERGEFGVDANPEEQIRRFQAAHGQPAVFERTRPNGRVIEVRQNPVPGGGFVLIYADITERKRNEAEIRAARDAAEEASRTIEAAYRELKTAQANLIQAEKMASLGQLTAGIAHEIKNPLNFVNNFAELSVDLLGELKDAIAPAEAALNQDQRDEVDAVVITLTGNLEKITEHGKRADGIVKAMLEHSRGSSAERRVVDMNALIDEALNLAYHGTRAQDQSFNIALERDFGEGIAPIEVNPQDMTRVFLNIISNGFYAVTRRARNGADTRFVPTLRVTTRDSGDAMDIRVWDNGIGIPADIRDKLFQPFFTTKPTGEGTGLGLSITYDIVTKAHGGSIAVDSEVGEYSEFTIRLPRNPRASRM